MDPARQRLDYATPSPPRRVRPWVVVVIVFTLVLLLLAVAWFLVGIAPRPRAA